MSRSTTLCLGLTVLLLLPLLVSAQSGCTTSGPVATALARTTSCKCPYEPQCLCIEGSTICANACDYCNPKGTICGWYSATAYEYQAGTAMSTALGYTFTYTKGRKGRITFLTDPVANFCGVFVDDKKCASCTLSPNKCPLSKRREPTFNCNSIVKGLSGTACSRKTAGGWLSLNNSALNTVGHGFIMPFLACANGNAVATEKVVWTSRFRQNGSVGNLTTLSSLRQPMATIKETSSGTDHDDTAALPFDLFSLLEEDVELMNAELGPNANNAFQSETAKVADAASPASSATATPSSSSSTSTSMTAWFTATATITVAAIMAAW